MKYINLLDPYFRSLGLPEGKGDAYALHPVAVFLLHDIIYQTFVSEVLEAPLKHRSAKIVGEWKEANHRHFSRLFLDLDQDSKDVVIDLMDELEETIANDLAIIKIAVMDGLSAVDLEKQKLLGAIQLCNLLAQLSDMLWDCCFQRKGHSHPYNKAIRFYTARLTALIWTNDGSERHPIKKGAADRLGKLVSALFMKIIGWINDRANREASHD